MGSLRDRMEEDLKLAGFSASTVRVYLTYARLFVKHFGRSPEMILEEEIRDFLLELLEKRHTSAGTFRQYRSAIRFLYEHTLRKPWRVASIPPSLGRSRQSLPVVLSRNEVAALFAATESVKYRTLFMAMYAAGLRVNEACCLRTTDIDAGRRMIHVRDGKMRKDRYVMLSLRLLSSLRGYWREARPKGRYLFPGETGEGHISTQSAGIVFRKAALLAGITKPASTHCLRHSFATHLLEDGTELVVIQALLGHRRLETTALYTRMSARHIAGTESPLDRLEMKEGPTVP